MKFGYSYKTSDGARHEAVFVAKRKEEVFEAMRAQGVRPIKVWEIRSPYAISKRTAAICVLATALAVALFALRSERQVARTLRTETPRGEVRVERHFVSLAAKPQLESAGENFLLRFACPAREVQRPADDVLDSLSKDLMKCLDKPLPDVPGESADAAELRGIVRTLKAEVREIVARGRTAREALDYLIERQEMEFGYRQRIVEKVAAGDMDKASANAVFRTMGFAELP